MDNPVWIESPNFTAGRNGKRPDIIVIHVIEGTLKSCDSWFSNPASEVSAHYGIGLKHELHQYVNEEDQAWHAGRVDNPTAKLIRERPNQNPNLFAIGIEHEGTANSIWPETLYEDSAELVAAIAQRWGIPIDRDHVIGHREVYSKKTCPGKGDVDRIVTLARGIVPAPAAPRVLRLGDRGEDVRAVQKRLAVKPESGFFGKITAAAVRNFQKKNGLVVDGVVGERTRQKLGL